MDVNRITRMEIGLRFNSDPFWTVMGKGLGQGASIDARGQVYGGTEFRLHDFVTTIRHMIQSGVVNIRK